MNKFLVASAALLATLAVTGTAPWTPPGAVTGFSAPNPTAVAVPVSAAPGAAPVLPFIENRGQLPDGVVFHAPSARAGTYVTEDGEIVYALPGARLTERFAGGSATPAGVERAPTRVASFVGNDPSRWTSDAATWNTVGFGEVWPGVEVDLHARQGSVEKFFTVAPGVTPESIRMEVDGAAGLTVDGEGRLVAALAGGEVAFSAPIAFQEVDGERRPVRVAYAADGLGYGFEVGDYDRSRPLVIDPTLVYSTFGGGNSDDEPGAFIVDAAGAVYVAGRTASRDLAITGGPFGTPADVSGGLNRSNGFLAKLAPDGGSYEFYIYIGGIGDDRVHGMRFGSDGSIFLVGATDSNDLPVSAGAAQPTRGGDLDFFVVKLNSGATAIQYLTYLGGPAREEVDSNLGNVKIEIDSAGRAYVYGGTEGPGYPVTANAPQATFSGGYDAVLTRIAADGRAFEFSTYLGGPGFDRAGFSSGALSDARRRTIAVRDDGRVWVAGRTGNAGFPTTPGAAQTTIPGNTSMFVASYDTSSGTLRYSTFVGGNNVDSLAGMLVDAAGRATLYGSTISSNFPTVPGGFDTIQSSTNRGFIVTLSEDGGSYVAGTFFSRGSGAGVDWIRVRPDGSLVMAGWARSGLPVTPGAYRTTVGSLFAARMSADLRTLHWATYLDNTDTLDAIVDLQLDAADNLYAGIRTSTPGLPANDGLLPLVNVPFNAKGYVVKLSADGTALIDAGYLDGIDDEDILGLHVDAQQRLYVVGATESANFPTTVGAADTTSGGDDEMFIVKMTTREATPPPSPGSIAWTAATASISEDGGTLTLTAARTGGSAGAASVQYATANGTATAGSDYTAASGALNWADGESGNKTVTISITNDTAVEPAETLAVTLSNPAGATLGTPATVTVTINDDDVATPGTIAWTAATASVSEAGGTLTLTATRTGGSSGAASAQYATANGTATAGSDYTAASGALNWADGESGSKTVTISITNDTAVESVETFTVTLSNAAGATLGTPATVTVTINDDDDATPGTLAFSAASYSANEGPGAVTVSVTRTGGTTGAASVNYAVTGGTATAGQDFTASSGTLSWAAGEGGAKSFTVAILDDSIDEPNETVNLTLSGANGATLGTPATATLTIVDNDAPATTAVRARGSFGGGSVELWLLGLLGLLALRKRRRLAGAACVPLALAVLPAPVQAADAAWYVGARGGVASSSLGSSELNRSLPAGVRASVDDQDFGGALYVGREFGGGLALELGYVDLGEYDVEVTGEVENPAALLRQAVDRMGDGGSGFTLVARWNLRFGEGFEVAPRAGLYYWDSERELRAGSTVVKRDESGTDFTGGVSLAWRPTESWSLGLAWDYFAQGDRNDVNVYGLQVEYRWP
jgi:hypothetical protein